LPKTSLQQEEEDKGEVDIKLIKVCIIHCLVLRLQQTEPSA